MSLQPFPHLRRIDFTDNWNSKLFCEYFISVQYGDPSYFVENEYYSIWIRNEMQNEYFGRARLTKMNAIKYQDISDTLAYLAIGACSDVLKTQLDKVKPDMESATLYVLTFQNIDFPTKAKLNALLGHKRNMQLELESV